jgi:FkbM family methyltransferase
MTFIDIGANMGLYTLFASKKVGKQGVVLAIEPSIREFQRLRENAELNGLANVRLFQLAVSNRRTEAELLVATEEKSGHNTLGVFGYDSVMRYGEERVRVEPLDDIVQQEGLQHIDLIKMDIEGAEFLALQGAMDTLTKFHPIILLELSNRTLQHQGYSSADIWEFLTQNGYRIYAFDSNTGLPVPAQRKHNFDAENVIAVHELSRGKRLW